MNDQHTNGSPPGAAGRRKTRAQERIESLESLPASVADELQVLKDRLGLVEQEAAESKAGWQRTAADFQNFRRRTEQQREETLGLANESLLRKLLVVADDFDRAMAQMPPDLVKLGWVEGIWAIDRKLRQLLDSEGLTPIEAEGRPFDPREHEAIAHEETTEVPDGVVLSEVQRGYRIRDRVLRPAMVTVAKNESNPPGNDTGREAAGG